jgi:hypothetical protein
MHDTESVLVHSNIDRRTCGRVKPMKVLVLGLCRTGTLCESPYPRVADTILHVVLNATDIETFQQHGWLCRNWVTTRIT